MSVAIIFRTAQMDYAHQLNMIAEKPPPRQIPSKLLRDMEVFLFNNKSTIVPEGTITNYIEYPFRKDKFFQNIHNR